MKTVQQKYVKIKMKKKATTLPKEREEERKSRRCPYLSSNSRKICRKMSEEGLDGRVSSFDIKHFCRSNPVYCYYFRSHSSKQ